MAFPRVYQFHHRAVKELIILGSKSYYFYCKLLSVISKNNYIDKQDGLESSLLKNSVNIYGEYLPFTLSDIISWRRYAISLSLLIFALRENYDIPTY